MYMPTLMKIVKLKLYVLSSFISGPKTFIDSRPGEESEDATQRFIISGNNLYNKRNADDIVLMEDKNENCTIKAIKRKKEERTRSQS